MTNVALQNQLEMYLSLKESLGGVPRNHKRALQSFLQYLDEHGDSTILRAQLAIDWARGTGGSRSASSQYALLSLARGFLTYLKASCPQTEIPGKHLIGSCRRPKPYILTDTETSKILEVASEKRKKARNSDTALWHYTCECVIGLIACTGLRVSEALNLVMTDVRLSDTPPALLIRKTKFKKSRWVPLHPTAAQKLTEYVQVRHAAGLEESSSFFLSILGNKIKLRTIQRAFRRILRRAGMWRPGRAGPTLQALRHTFAVNRLKTWYETGADARVLAPHLSVYMGHVNVAATYWYISATPELLLGASKLFENHLRQGGIE